MRKKKIISAFLVGVLSFCNCFPALAMETQGNTIISNETPIEMETQHQGEMVTPEKPTDVGDLMFEEKEMIGAGHSFGSATYISINTEIVDNLVDGDSNYYAFTLPKNGKINIDFSHEIFENSNRCWVITLYDSNHTEIDYFYSTNGYSRSAVSWDYGLSAGTYYLTVDSTYGNSTDRIYSFKVNYLQTENWETEFNNSWLTADKLQLNKNYYGSMVSSDESIDYYTFKLDKDGKINIDFSHEIFENNNRCWVITLYDSDHNEIDYFHSTNGYSRNVTSWDYGLPAGTYYLTVDSTYGNYTGRTYSFKINYTQTNNWETEFNDSWLTADKLQLNTDYYGSMASADENSDFYSFIIPRYTAINIKFSHEIFEDSNCCWVFTLYDSEHEKIQSFVSTNGYDKSGITNDYYLPSGTYYLTIDNTYGNYTGRTYSFKINTKPALNETFKYGNGYYKVKSNGISKEVQFVKMADPDKTAFTIPSKVTYHGFTYNVTGVRSDAFKNNKKIKSITLGKNITVLGNNVFYGCRNLKKITVKGTKLKKVGSKALKGITKNAVIKVPKSKISTYKKLFKGKGQSKNVKVKKL